MPSSYPVALHLAQKKCLVVGSGSEAAERAQALTEAGAEVIVVCEQPSEPLKSLLAERGLEHRPRQYQGDDLDGIWLAVLTDRDFELGARIAEQALARRVLFCATDQPQDNSYSHLALARAGLVTIAVGTEGRAPALGRRLREELVRVFSAAKLAAFADRIAGLRERTPAAERQKVLSKAVAGVYFDGALHLPNDDAPE